MLIFTPEYNGSIPAVTKNAVDWLSRRHGEGPIIRKPVGTIVAVPGRGGAGLRSHLSDSLSGLTDAVFDPSHRIGSINHKLSQGRLIGEAADELATWLDRFCSFARDVGEADVTSQLLPGAGSEA